jgi:2-isopropylmalate synthase
MIMKVRSEIMPYRTAINAEHLYPASQLLTEFISFGPQPNKAIVGSNAFAHEAGIHQDGYLKERSTYEIMDPQSVGVPDSKLVLGKHSGRHALADRAKSFGYELTREQLDLLYDKFTTLADRKKGLTNDEILELVQREIVQPVSVAN